MLTFHRDLGRCLVVHADAFAMLAVGMVTVENDARRFEHRCKMFYDLTLSLRELGKVVKLSAGQPL